MRKNIVIGVASTFLTEGSMRFIVRIILAMVFLSLTNTVQAAPEVDQQQLQGDGVGGIAFWSNNILAQTFIPAISGKLVQIYLPLGFNPSQMALNAGITSEKVHVAVSEWLTDRPGPVLGSVDLDIGSVHTGTQFSGTVDLSGQQIILGAGRQYAILLNNDLIYGIDVNQIYGDFNPYRNTGVSVAEDVYPGGSVWSLFDPSVDPYSATFYEENYVPQWTERKRGKTGYDFTFVTYMDRTINPDDDADLIPNLFDNCPTVYNPDQANSDSDTLGDICDSCPFDAENDIDADSICGDEDNCRYINNPDQTDSDGDGLGDACNCVMTSTSERGKTCKDNVDNDCDGMTDAADPDCGATSEPDSDAGGNEGKGKSCSDGLDNDADGLTDCDDSGCSANKVCR